jgi:AcrR family transcriptional regulator
MSPRSKKLSEQMKAESRKTILNASLKLFAKKGFSATTTDEIARKAKVSKGLIFSHFSSKEDLLFSMIDENIERWLPTLDDSGDSRSPKEKLLSLIESMLNLLKTEPDLIRLSLRLNLDEAYRKIIEKRGKALMERFLGRVRKLFKQLGSKNPDLDCYLFMFLFDGISANYTVAPDLFPIELIKEHFLKVMFTYLEKK